MIVGRVVVPAVSRWQAVGEVVKALVPAVFGANLGMAVYDGRTVVAIVWAAFIAVSIALHVGDTLRTWRRQYQRGVLDTVHVVNRAHTCDHSWTRHRDEQTETLSWHCTRCHAHREI